MEENTIDQKDKYQLRFLVMPDTVYQDERLSALQLKVLCFIYSFRGDQFYFSNLHLGNMFKAHESSISRVISQLEEYGYIRTIFKIKADGGKIRFVTLNQQVSSDSTKRLSPTQPLSEGNGNKINDNVLDKSNTRINAGLGIIEKVVKRQEYGNLEVNLILKVFRDTWGHDPTDRQPRSHAWNLARSIKKFLTEKNKYTPENFEKVVRGLMKWLSEQPWGEEMHNMDTVRRKFKLFNGDQNGIPNKNQ